MLNWRYTDYCIYLLPIRQLVLFSMSDSQSLLPKHLDFFALLKQQEMQKARRRGELASLVVNTPILDDLLKEIIWLGPVEREAVLRCHPGHKIERKLQSLWAMLSVFNKAHEDLLAQLNHFHAFSLTDEMFLPVGRQQLEEINMAVKKELVAFSAAASALVAFSRRLKDSIVIPELDEQLAETFDMQEHKFVTSLRNVIFHQEFPDVGWQVKYQAERETDFVISIEELRHQDGLPREARAFVEQYKKGIHVRALAESYSARVLRFYNWYKSAIEERIPEQLADYRRIVRACMANATRTTFRLLFQQINAKKIDPFEHLHKYLLPAQLDNALILPMRSKEQVDFIIAAVDKYGACDDELRQMIYRLFEVPK